MDIGKPQRVIQVEPLKAPAEIPPPIEEPAPAREAEPVPAGRAHRPNKPVRHDAAR